VIVSVLDDLHGFEQRVVARLHELQPLVTEYEELQQVAARMGIDVTAPQRAQAPARRQTRKRTPKRSASSRRRPGGTKATGVERRARILELIGEQPGITVSEISKDIGVDPPPLYRVVRKLQAEGVVKKEGAALRLAS
jgi:ribosomal protein S25